MKYTILTNQAGIVASGLHVSTDLVDWALLEYVADWQIHGRAHRLDDHVWLNYQHLINEMPMMKLNKKNSVSNRVKKLVDLGLLSIRHDDDGRCYVKTTDYYSDVVRFRPDMASIPVGNAPSAPRSSRGTPVPHEEHPVPHEEHPVPHEEHPVPHEEHPVPHEEHSINNQLINNQEQTKPLAGDAAQEGGESFSDDQVFEAPMQWAQFFIRECGYPFGIVQTARTIPMFAQWVKDSVTVGDVRMAIIAANAYNGGLIPDNPMLYGKFLRSVLNEKQRLAEEAAFAARPDVGRARQQVEEWAKIPRNDDDLCAWAAKHGYPSPARGDTWRQYRAKLQTAVEARLSRSAEASHG